MRKYALNFIVQSVLCIIVMQGYSQGIVTDIEGNTYNTIVIGGQEWMTDNLRVSIYRNGDIIPSPNNIGLGENSAIGFWVLYNDNSDYDITYGKLYNWYAISDPRGICPLGWSIPTDNDWQNLVDYIDAKAWGNNNIAGTQLKSSRQINSPLGGENNTSEHPRWDYDAKRFGTNDYNFNALPAGLYTPSAQYAHLGSHAYFWSLTEGDQDQAWIRMLVSTNKGISRSQYPKNIGLSVRCIKGELNDIQVPQIVTHKPNSITTSSFIIGGEVTDNGNDNVIDRGFVWGSQENPTADNHEGILSSGSGLGTFTETISGLTSGNTYWVRAYAQNASGIAYGIQKRVTTPVSTTIPTLSTRQVSAISTNSASSGGIIASEGGMPILSKGVVWNNEGDVTLSNNLGLTEDGEGGDSFISTIGSLSPSTTYYVRAYATNAEGAAYGDVISFQTLAPPISTFRLSLSVNPSNGGSTSGAGNYEEGAAISLSATAADGYQFVNWTNGGAEVSNLASFSFTMPAEDVTLVANFEPIPAPTFTLTLSANPSNGGSAAGEGEYEEGESIGLSATPADGYQFVNWTNGGSEVSTQASFSYTMSAQDVTLVANFEETTASTDGETCEGIPTVTDYDNNIYHTVHIGGQCWLKENLKTTSYSDGTAIPKRQTNATWLQAGSNSEGGYSVYPYTSVSGINSEEEMLEFYGGLYNWYAVDNSKGLCPTGWLVATDADWNQLTNYLANEYGYSLNITDVNGVGNVLKSCRQVNSSQGGDCSTSQHPRWDFHSIHSGFDSFNFSALPGGYRMDDASFMIHSTSGFWWTSSASGQTILIFYDYGGVSPYSLSKSNGLSVRCIKE